MLVIPAPGLSFCPSWNSWSLQVAKLQLFSGPCNALCSYTLTSVTQLNWDRFPMYLSSTNYWDMVTINTVSVKMILTRKSYNVEKAWKKLSWRACKGTPCKDNIISGISMERVTRLGKEYLHVADLVQTFLAFLLTLSPYL